MNEQPSSNKATSKTVAVLALLALAGCTEPADYWQRGIAVRTALELCEPYGGLAQVASYRGGGDISVRAQCVKDNVTIHKYGIKDIEQ